MSCVDHLRNKITELQVILRRMCKKEKINIWNPKEYVDNTAANDGKYALVILNRPISLAFKQSFILNLWSRATLRVTVDGGTNHWLSWLKSINYERNTDYAPDIITGDLDSIYPDTLEFFIKSNTNTKIIKTPNQNETDFTKALMEVHKYIIRGQLKIENIIVLANSSGRFDHIIANINTLFKANKFLPNINVILLAYNSLTWLLKENVAHRINIPSCLLQQWCALLPIGNSCIVTTTGLKWNLNNTLLEFGKLVSSSNTYSGQPFVTVQSNNPIIWSMGIKGLL